MIPQPVFDAAEFIRAQTLPAPASFVPEISLYLATEVTPLWQMTEDTLNQKQLPPPFWAFAWPGGQGVARYILDNQAIVRGKRVLDFAAGGGIGSIAAMKAGALVCTAVDIDALALQAIKLNAALNGVTVDTGDGIDMTKPPAHIDLIIAGDVCYQQSMAASLMRWFCLCVASGIRVIMADPGRAYLPRTGLTELAAYAVPTLLDLEDQASRTVRVWDVGLSVVEN